MQKDVVQLSFILFADGLSVSEMTGSGTNCQPALPNQPSQPMYFVALARLQLTNLPHAGDLMPNRSYEFTTRLSGEGIINFCDHRVLNVLQTHSPASQTISPKGLLGVPFTDLIVGAEDQAAFSDLLSQAWNSKGQQYSISLRLRLPPSSPHSSAAVTSETALHDQVAVRCTIYAFLNPYSNEVEYVVCTVTSMKCLQEAAEASEADHTFYTASYPSTSRHHQQGGEDTSYWKSSHESFALQPQPCYVTTTASAPNSQQQYDFGAGHNHHEQMSRLKFSEAGEGYPDRMDEVLSVDSYSQQQSAPHHPYLSGGTPYVQHPTQLPFTTASAYSTTPSPDAAACDVVTTGRTSAISYLPRPREQRDNEMQKEWYLTSDPQSYTSQHPYVLSSDQSSFLGYLHQAPAAATAASPPTYNVSSGL
uniref:Aryl hydrocarbon receptor nuclear translocator n=1 Tax=Mesocestoides corti TaxID=53468 RepID=A0A5K3G1C4_MESCO